VRSSIGECKGRIGYICYIKKRDRRMNELAEIVWQSVPKSWYHINYGAVAEFHRGLDWRPR